MVAVKINDAEPNIYQFAFRLQRRGNQASLRSTRKRKAVSLAASRWEAQAWNKVDRS